MFEIWANMWSLPNCHFCAKSIKNSRKQVKNGSFSAIFWSKWRDSNSRPPVPETGALPTALHLEMVKIMRFSVSGQTCGQGTEIGHFSGRCTAKKVSVFKGFGRFSKNKFWNRWFAPETGALPTALHLDLVIFMRFSVSGQTCGQTENLRTFKTSGKPKKSVFSRDLGVFQKINFKIGGLHPKLARYQLRYTSIWWFLCDFL